MCSNVNPSTDNYVGISIGMSGVSIVLGVTKKSSRTEIYISRGLKEENKKIFDFFLGKKDKIEADFGRLLEWERMDDNVTCRIKDQLDDVDISNKDYWPKMNEF